MSRGRMALIVGLGCTLAGLSRGAQGADKVRLIGWEGVATLGSQRGYGQDYFDLLAHVVWQRNVTGRFAVRVKAPGGSTDNQPLSANQVGSREILALVKASSVQNLPPANVTVSVCVIDADSNAEVSNTLVATIDDFPRPQPGGPGIDRGPFGWGSPLSG
ncbi:SUMF1/EgtB/PvdO family nonheme iron enzyme, partial [Singulisphaera rosea]